MSTYPGTGVLPNKSQRDQVIHDFAFKGDGESSPYLLPRTPVIATTPATSQTLELALLANASPCLLSWID